LTSASALKKLKIIALMKCRSAVFVLVQVAT